MRIPLTPDQLAEMRRLWETEPGLTAVAIGERLGVSRNAVIGQAHRRGWLQRRETIAGDYDHQTARLDALNLFPPAGFCVYPHGHPGHDGFRFCALPVRGEGASYCDEHHKRCHIGEKSKLRIEEWDNDPIRRLRAAEHARKVAAGKRRAA